LNTSSTEELSSRSVLISSVVCARAPRPVSEAARGLDAVLHAELAAAVLGRGAARVDVEAHRGIDPPAVDHDALHAEHYHGGEHLLALPRDGAARERHELLGIAGLDALLRAEAEHRAHRLGLGHAGARLEPQRNLGELLRVGRIVARLDLGQVVFDLVGKMLRHPAAHADDAELRALEPLGRCRHVVEQLNVELHLLLTAVQHRFEHAVD
jgi:hypothetical protein